MRLVILSNRLKVTVKEQDGALEILPSSGGLVTGLGAYLSSAKDLEYIWMGWPGSTSYSNPEEVKKTLMDNYNCVPVFVEEKTMDLFYNGFCNKTIWPLFHYFTYFAVYDEKMWNNYREVNEIFAREVSKVLKEGDVVWVHDYHFMLVPHFIKEEHREIPVGFFLHIPFPSYEAFRLLPRKWGKEILAGLLDADLVGFHTYDYTQYFLRCVLRVLGINHNMGMLALEHKLTKTGTFPMGIDYEKYYNASTLDEVKKEKALLKKQLQRVKVIFSVDRQDYTKGILNRLEGYELFLKNNPDWREKVVLLMIIVPSRIGVEDYERAKFVINQLIGKINGEFGSIHWTPVIYQYKAISFEQLVALYNTSDVGLVTPLRDGMNLVAKEYIACQREKRGVLILSEMAGSAMELGEAIVINPNNREEIADAITAALEMKPDEQAKRIASMQERIKKYDVNKWAADYLDGLRKAMEEQKKYGTVALTSDALDTLVEKYNSAERRIIFLDYDGTLVPIADKPHFAIPDKKILSLLKRLSRAPDTDIVIISGRTKSDLTDWFGKLKIILVAEHGVWIKKPKDKWRIVRHLRNDWKPGITRILEKYRDRLPDSFIEEKEYSVVWHFRNASLQISELRVKEFVDDMIQFTAANEIDVLLGKKVVEIKCSGVGKGETARELLSSNDYDFILAAGDDDTDETLFQSMPEDSFTIKIGKQKSFANYYLETSANLLSTLEKFVEVKKGFFQNFMDFLRRK